MIVFFLHECNEFSVELCQSALRLWNGKRLVLVESDWQGLISELNMTIKFAIHKAFRV